MDDTHSLPPLRRSQRQCKRPHQLRDFVIEENDEPVSKSPRLREANKLHHTTLQSEKEQMALQDIEKLISELSSSQKLTIEKIESTNSGISNQLKCLEERVSKLSDLVGETRLELNNKIDKLERTPTEPNNTASGLDPLPLSVPPLIRSTSSTSINSVESVEQITRQISQSITSALGAHKKLIALPKFNGEAERWPQFSKVHHC